MPSNTSSPVRLEAIEPPPWRLFPSLPGDSGTLVPTIDPPSDASFRAHYFLPQRPVVIRGLCSDWRATTAWSFDSIRRNIGSRVVPAFPTKDGMLGYDEEAGTVARTGVFSELLDSIEHDAKPKWFLMLYPGTDVPEFEADVQAPEYCSRALWKKSRVTIAGPGALTPLHREIADNFFCVFSGEKEFVLFPANETRNLYALSVLSGAPHFSHVEPRDSDLSRFPRVSKVTPWRCTLRAGDAIYVPRRWWHAVSTSQPAVGMGYWWAEGIHSTLPLAAAAYKKLRALKT